MELGTVNGEVELLIGSEVAHLHPQYQETVGRMVVRKSIFGTGWVLNGAHEEGFTMMTRVLVRVVRALVDDPPAKV